MEFLTSTILSGIIYDLIKSGIKLSINNVFSLYDIHKMDYNTCEEFIGNINAINDKEHKVKYVSDLLNNENKYTTLFEQQLYPTNFAKRLDYILTFINDCGYWEQKINVEKLGDYLGFKSVNNLKQYYIKDVEPDYEFIENIANKLGINTEWLKYGQGEPFASSLRRIYNATDILKDNIVNDVSEFIFVIDDGDYRRDIGIIVRFDEFKYSYYPRTLVFHADVGASGASELFSVYKFLKELNELNKMPSGVYKVSEEESIDFFSGKIYPGMIKKYKQDGCNFLLDDFIDLYVNDSHKEEYKSMYGETFVNCQDLIKRKLNQMDLSSDEIRFET